MFREQVLWKRKAEQDGCDRRTKRECNSVNRMVRVSHVELRFEQTYGRRDMGHADGWRKSTSKGFANAKAQRWEKSLAHQRTCKKARVTKTK